MGDVLVKKAFLISYWPSYIYLQYKYRTESIGYADLSLHARMYLHCVGVKRLYITSRP